MTPSIIQSGDRVFFDVHLKNEGNTKACGVRGTFSSTSNIVKIEPLDSAYYIRFTHIADCIYAGKSGYAVITNGQTNSTTWNGMYYAVEFLVSDSANVGDTINFNIDINDDSGNEWTDNFTLTVE